MAILPIMTNVKGPLTVSQKFDAPLDGPCYFSVTGSVWSSNANVMIGVLVELDGKPIGGAYIFSNQVSEHRAMIPVNIPLTITFGTHVLSLLPANAVTTSDFNDLFNVSLFY